MHIESMQIFD